jgi:hypothetical protein
MIDPSEEATECYRRAAKCRKLAERSTDEKDRQFYLERESAWLALARRFELSNSVGTFLQELERKRRRIWPRKRAISMMLKLPNCSAYNIQMQHREEQSATTIFERHSFHCPECGHLSDLLAAVPRD